MNKNNVSGVTGVYFDASSSKWRAQISFCGKKVKLGYFSSLDDAIFARETAEAAKQYRGKLRSFLFSKYGDKYVEALFSAALSFSFGGEFCIYAVLFAERFFKDCNKSFPQDRIRGITSAFDILSCEDVAFEMFVDGYTIREISRKLEISQGNATKRVKEKLKNLKLY